MTQEFDLFTELSPHAYEKLSYFQNQGIALMPGTTICVMVSSTDRWYSEVSSVSNTNGNFSVSHSERDTLNTMIKHGDPIVKYVLLIDANGNPMIPCPGCIQYILNANPQNANALMVLPNNDTRPLASFLQNSMMNAMPTVDDGTYPVPNAPYSGMSPLNAVNSMPKRSVAISVQVQTESSSGNILKDRLAAVKQSANTEVEPETVETKKKFFGLF